MLDRLTAQDLLMLGADDFGWSEDIGVLTILDGTRLLDGDGRVRIDEVRRRLEAKLHLVPRSGSCCTGPGGGWAGRGEDVQGLVPRVMAPISLHREQPGLASGNQDSVMVVPLPLGEPDPGRRLDLIGAETAARKRRARPQMGSGIFGSVAVQRLWYRFLARRRRCTLPAPGCWRCSRWRRSWAT
jgi:hypothetical protein